MSDWMLSVCNVAGASEHHRLGQKRLACAAGLRTARALGESDELSARSSAARSRVLRDHTCGLSDRALAEHRRDEHRRPVTAHDAQPDAHTHATHVARLCATACPVCRVSTSDERRRLMRPWPADVPATCGSVIHVHVTTYCMSYAHGGAIVHRYVIHPTNKRILKTLS